MIPCYSSLLGKHLGSCEKHWNHKKKEKNRKEKMISRFLLLGNNLVEEISYFNTRKN